MFLYKKKLKKATKADEQAFHEKLQEENLDKNDGIAMILAAFLTVILPCLLILLVLGGLILLLFGAF